MPSSRAVQGIKDVLDMCHYGRKKKCQYLVRWKGYPDSDNKWVDHEDMNALEAINAYERT